MKFHSYETSDSIEAYIKVTEGLHLVAYICPANKWTIGYGSTRDFNGLPPRPGRIITKDEAEQLFERDMREAEKILKRHVKVELTHNQFDALTSFVYNIGEGNFAFVNQGKPSTVLRLLNQGDYQGAAKAMNAWVHGDKIDPVTRRKEILPGLVKRRKYESSLFQS